MKKDKKVYRKREKEEQREDARVRQSNKEKQKQESERESGKIQKMDCVRNIEITVSSLGM